MLLGDARFISPALAVSLALPLPAYLAFCILLVASLALALLAFISETGRRAAPVRP